MSTSEIATTHSPDTTAAAVSLFSPLQIREVVFRNRIAVSPMCQYSSEDGFANDWHLVHLGSRAVGGAGLVVTEATAVEARGRISQSDLGIWKDEHIEPLARIVRFLKQHSAVPGIQLAHAGRKASTDVPWRGGRGVAAELGGWQPIAPTSLPFSSFFPMPAELSLPEIQNVIQAFASAAQRALKAGFEVIELHGAHGYLIHEFLSPLSNHRNDAYGGSLQNRIRFALEIVEAVRAVWPNPLLLFLRISATDWVPDGWTVDDSVRLASAVVPLGVDLIDCSSGGTTPQAPIPVGPGYQVRFAEQIRRQAGILTGAVGMITDPHQADTIIREEKADLVFIARELLREPYWPIKAASQLDASVAVPIQYSRAFENPVPNNQRT
jgi:2,4-dienoyl-CoA reductase-like NADH-dependent reductase (Old Yellow Enzyme family)